MDILTDIKHKQAKKALAYLRDTATYHKIGAADIVACMTYPTFDAYWDACLHIDMTAALNRWCSDVCQGAGLAKIRRDKDAIRKAREDYAASKGGIVCKRCSGAGGHNSWPGYTCFDCGGEGYVIG